MIFYNQNPKKFPDKNLYDPMLFKYQLYGISLTYFNRLSKNIVDFYGLKLNEKVIKLNLYTSCKNYFRHRGDPEICIHNLSFYATGVYTK